MGRFGGGGCVSQNCPSFCCFRGGGRRVVGGTAWDGGGGGVGEGCYVGWFVDSGRVFVPRGWGGVGEGVRVVWLFAGSPGTDTASRPQAGFLHVVKLCWSRTRGAGTRAVGVTCTTTVPLGKWFRRKVFCAGVGGALTGRVVRGGGMRTKWRREVGSVSRGRVVVLL